MNGVSVAAGGEDNWNVGTYLGVAIDLTAHFIWFSVNGTYQDSGNPAAGTSGKTISSGTYYPVFGRRGLGTNMVTTANFDAATAFNTAAPSGFSAWETAAAGSPRASGWAA